MNKFTFFSLTILSVLALAGCTDSDAPFCPTMDCVVRSSLPGDRMDVDLSTRKLALAKTNSCDAYRKHLLDALAVRVAKTRFGYVNSCYYDYRYTSNSKN